MKRYLLGIDVGTTGTKTLLFDAGGADSWIWVDAPWPWEMEE